MKKLQKLGLVRPQKQREIVPTVRGAIIDQNLDPETELGGLDLDNWPGKQAARTILQIFAYQADSALAIRFYDRTARSIVDEWDEVLDRRGYRDHHFNHEYFERLARFALKLGANQALDICAPFVTAVGNHPEEVCLFIRQLIIEEDRCAGPSTFWDIWQRFANVICEAPWIGRIDSQYVSGKELVRTIFLGGAGKRTCVTGADLKVSHIASTA